MLEKNRPDFKVMSVEQKREVKIGPLELTLRIDRIDQLSDGSHLIIDYKTSKNNSLKYWFTERPDEPQLPLYCITHSAETGGIAFAEIQAKTFSLKGISKNALDIKTMIPFHKVNFAENKTWNEQLQSWQHILEKMSHDFYQGVASVDPKNPAETCQYCDLQSLCRIHEKRVKV
jgi:ATP-dependent helicase/DNAse subunit B